MTAQKASQSPEMANRMPLNQAAAKWLAKTSWGTSSESANVATLMLWGLVEGGLRPTKLDDPENWLLGLEKRLGPVGLTRLVAGQQGDEANLWPADLEEVEDPEEAAAILLESLYLNWMAE